MNSNLNLINQPGCELSEKWHAKHCFVMIETLGLPRQCEDLEHLVAGDGSHEQPDPGLPQADRAALLQVVLGVRDQLVQAVGLLHRHVHVRVGEHVQRGVSSVTVVAGFVVRDFILFINGFLFYCLCDTSITMKFTKLIEIV